MSAVPGEVAPPTMTPNEQALLACVQSLRRSVEALIKRVDALEQRR